MVLPDLRNHSIYLQRLHPGYDSFHILHGRSTPWCHSPSQVPLSTALGLIAAVLIGQIAIDVGMFTPEVILYVAIAATGGYVTPSHELSVANKVISLFLIVLTGFFGLIGFTVSIVLHVLFLTHMRSLRTPYLWPLIPFNPRAMLHTIIRIPAPFTNSRPSIVHPKNNYRQPDKSGRNKSR